VQTDPFLLIPLLGIGLAYVVGYRRFARLPHTHAGFRVRAGLFAMGYAALVVALVSPLHALGERSFALHMVQHLLLLLVAAPLLLLSNSMPVMMWALPRQERATLGRLVGQPGRVRSLLRTLTHPMLAWWLFVGTQWLWHQPVAYEWALASRWAHYFEHITFFATSILFWWPVIGAAPLPSPLSYPARLAYTFLAWLPNSLLGAGISMARGPLYGYYVNQARTQGADPSFDQQLAGLIMWVPGDILFVSILLALFVAYLRNEEREAERIDRELDAQEAAAARALTQHVGT
jgi:cytochrome c oxidase assembly factor CtaG